MDSETQTLAGFLLERIAEDETVARKRTVDDVVDYPPLEPGTPDQLADHEAMEADRTATGPHFVDVITPARILAECEAKRRVIELHDHPGGECWEMHRGFVAADWKEEWDGRKPGEPWAHPSLESDEVHPGPCETLQLLALPYADHPDYRDEWRP